MSGYITSNIGSTIRYNGTVPQVVQDIKLEYLRMTNTLRFAWERLQELYTYKGDIAFWGGVADSIEGMALGGVAGGLLIRKLKGQDEMPTIDVKPIQHEITTRLRNNEIFVPAFLLQLYDQKIKEIEHDIVQFQDQSIARASHQSKVIEITIDVLAVFATAGAANLLKGLGFISRFAAISDLTSKIAGTIRMAFAGAGINLFRNVSELGGKIVVGLETEWKPGLLNILFRFNFDLTIGFFVSCFGELGLDRISAFFSRTAGKMLSNQAQEFVREKLTSFFVNRSTECSWVFLSAILNHAENPTTQQDVKEEIFDQLGLEKWLIDSLPTGN